MNDTTSNPSQVSSNVTLSLKELGELKNLLLDALEGKQISDTYKNILNGSSRFPPFAPILERAKRDPTLRTELECAIFVDLTLYPYTIDMKQTIKNFKSGQPKAANASAFLPPQ